MIQKIRSFFIDFLTSGLGSSRGLIIMGKFVLLNLVIGTGIVYLLPYSVIAYNDGRMSSCIADLITAIALAIAAAYLRISKRHRVVVYLVCFVMAGEFYYLFISNPPGLYQYIWSFTLPLFVLFLLGRRAGAIFTISYFLIFIATVVINPPFLQGSFSFNFLLRFSCVYLAILIYSFFSHISTR